MKDILKAAMDDQRKLLHERIVNLCENSDEVNNFIIEVMTGLPYPDLEEYSKQIKKRNEQITQP